MNCQKHRDRQARGQCVNCYAFHCQECLEKRKVGSTLLDICPLCKDLIRPIRSESPKIPFYNLIGKAVSYPLAPNDRMKLVGYGAFLLFMAFMYSIMPLNPVFYANWIVKTALWSIFVSYIVRAVNTVGMGALEVPEWPDFVDWTESLVKPSVRVSLTGLVLIGLPILICMTLVITQIGWGLSDVLFGGPSPSSYRISEERMKEETKKEFENMQRMMVEMQQENMTQEEARALREGMLEENGYGNAAEKESAKVEGPSPEKASQDPGFVGRFIEGLSSHIQASKAASKKINLMLIFASLAVFGLLSLLGTMLYPLAFYIAAGFGSLRSALNPVTLIKLILLTPSDYLKLLLILFASSVAQYLISLFFSALGIFSIFTLGKFVSLSINFYFGLFFAFIVGRFAYDNRFKLGFEREEKLPELKPLPPTESPPQTSKGYASAKTDMPPDEHIIKGREFKKLGELNKALECFYQALSINPMHPLALRESFKIHLSRGNSEKAESTINKLMTFYTSKDRRDEALILFSEVMGVLPMHTFGQIAQKKIANWLKEVGDFKNAAIAYRNYAYKFMHDPFAATSLMEAGLLCKSQLANPKLAKKIFEMLINNYPKASEAIEAETLLTEIHD